MQIVLNKAELVEFIDEQVKAGRFASHEAALAAAVEQMMYDCIGGEIDDETIAAIDRAEEQIARGEGIDFKTFAAEMRRKMTAQ